MTFISCSNRIPNFVGIPLIISNALFFMSAFSTLIRIPISNSVLRSFAISHIRSTSPIESAIIIHLSILSVISFPIYLAMNKNLLCYKSTFICNINFFFRCRIDPNSHSFYCLEYTNIRIRFHRIQHIEFFKCF